MRCVVFASVGRLVQIRWQPTEQENALTRITRKPRDEVGEDRSTVAKSNTIVFGSNVILMLAFRPTYIHRLLVLYSCADCVYACAYEMSGVLCWRGLSLCDTPASVVSL